MTLLDAAYSLDELAAGRMPDRVRLLAGALAFDGNGQDRARQLIGLIGHSTPPLIQRLSVARRQGYTSETAVDLVPIAGLLFITANWPDP
jgi:hypothetical protein